jgi:hypothetical protein
VAGVFASSAFAVTLMACYGLPPCQETADADRDGYPICLDNGGLGQPEDCDDQNASIHPGAEDPPGDGVDQNCDGRKETSGTGGSGGSGGSGAAGGSGASGGTGGSGGSDGGGGSGGG